MELELIEVIKTITKLLLIAMMSSLISTLTVQKIKERLKNKKWLYFASVFISISLGILFAIYFPKVSIFDALWVGLFTWIGADNLYKAFEDKIFTKFSDIVKKDDTKIKEDTISIKRDDI